jgi:hypothetical protein
MKFIKAIFLLLFLPLSFFGQNLAGIWEGYFEAAGNDVPYELFITDNEGQLEGYAMTTIEIKGSQNVGIKSVKFRIKKNQLILEDDELIFNNFYTPPKKVIFTASLKFITDGPVMDLAGNYRTRSLDFRDKSYYAGKVVLRRKTDPDLSPLVKRLGEMKLLRLRNNVVVAEQREVAKVTTEEKPEPVLKNDRDLMVKKEAIASRPNDGGSDQKRSLVSGADKKLAPKDNRLINDRIENPPAAFFESRETEVIQHLLFTGDSVTVSVYDNGTVDGDTVSIILNNKVIVAKKMLSSNPFKIRISMPDNMNDSLLLIMYAENLGAYPPNTGLIVLQDDHARTEIRFAGDLKKSSAIVLKRARL